MGSFKTHRVMWPVLVTREIPNCWPGCTCNNRSKVPSHPHCPHVQIHNAVQDVMWLWREQPLPSVNILHIVSVVLLLLSWAKGISLPLLHSSPPLPQMGLLTLRSCFRLLGVVLQLPPAPYHTSFLLSGASCTHDHLRPTNPVTLLSSQDGMHHKSPRGSLAVK